MPSLEDEYVLEGRLGKGAFGEVFRARDKEGNIRAVKTFAEPYKEWSECLKLKEVESLLRLRKAANTLGFPSGTFPHVIGLIAVIRDSKSHKLHMVFEFAEWDLYQMMEDRAKRGESLAASKVNKIMKQLLRALEFIHPFYFHRDIKPENIMCNKEADLIKIIDFGQAREVRSRPPFTDYVGTRWYRAPEIQIHNSLRSNYSSPVDMWSAGCVLAELVELKPLFPATSGIDLLYRIVQAIDAPTKQAWPEGHFSLLANVNINAETRTHGLKSMVPKATDEQLELLQKLLLWNPTARLTAKDALQHSCFRVVEDTCNMDLDKRRSSVDEEQLRRSLSREISEEEAGPMKFLGGVTKAVIKFRKGLIKFRSKKELAKREETTDSFDYEAAMGDILEETSQLQENEPIPLNVDGSNRDSPAEKLRRPTFLFDETLRELEAEDEDTPPTVENTPTQNEHTAQPLANTSLGSDGIQVQDIEIGDLPRKNDSFFLLSPVTDKDPMQQDQQQILLKQRLEHLEQPGQRGCSQVSSPEYQIQPTQHQTTNSTQFENLPETSSLKCSSAETSSLSEKPRNREDAEQWRPLEEAVAEVERLWSEANPNTSGSVHVPEHMTMEQLLLRKKAVKSALRKFENDFARIHGREPTKVDKIVLKKLYKEHRLIKNTIAANS
eukprot:m.40799 g.40799  ORF g.40799 m.40799 type:complete len:666 (-) comp9712_c0_seq2:1889-3886(-)